MSLLTVGLVLGTLGLSDAVVTVRCHGARHDTRAAGFLVAEDGLVVTALHAVTGSEPEDVPLAVTVTTADGTEHRVVELLAVSVPRDLCLLRLAVRDAAWLRPAEEVSSGQPVVVLSDPRRPRQPGVETRLVGPRFDEVGNLRWRVEAPLRGRSGLPAVDAAGRVVGMVSTTHELIPITALDVLAAHPARVGVAEAHAALANTPYGLVDFAYHAYRHGRLPLAVGHLQRAVAMEPPLAAAHNMLAVFLARAGREEEAVVEYQRALRIRPDDMAARHNLALLLDERTARERLRAARRASAAAAPPDDGRSDLASLEDREDTAERAAAPAARRRSTARAPASRLPATAGAGGGSAAGGAALLAVLSAGGLALRAGRRRRDRPHGAVVGS